MASKGKKQAKAPNGQRDPKWKRAGYASPEAYRRERRDQYDNEGNHRKQGSWPRNAKNKHVIKAADVVADAETHATQPRLKNVGDTIMLPYWNAAATITGATVDEQGKWLYETNSIYMRIVSQDEIERSERGVILQLTLYPEPMLEFVMREAV